MSGQCRTGSVAQPLALHVSAQDLVERFFNKLKHYRAIATRYEKHSANYLALVKLAAIRIWLRHNESAT